MEKNCLLVNAGLIEYEKAHSMQKNFLERRINNESPDVLILAEHEPVITAGRGFREENLLVSEAELEKENIRLYRIERGGDATYHGPGQIMGYPIIDLSGYNRDVHWFVRSIEQVIIETLRDFGINGLRAETHPGVWVDGMKIASIGIAVRKWVAYHGFCLNVCPRMENFSFINPCGLDYNVLTSMERILKKKVSLEDVREKITRHYSRIFNIRFLTARDRETCLK